MATPFRTLIGLCIAALTAMLETNPATAACGCERMTIRTTPSPQTLCSGYALNFPECARSPGFGPCLGFNYRYDCPVGSTPPHPPPAPLVSYYGFVAESQLAAGSVLAECAEGQALQLTITSNMPSVDKPPIGYADPHGLITIDATTFFVQPRNGVEEYPDVGATNPAHQPFYGSDNYSNPASQNHLIQWSDPILKWWDNTDQEKDAAAEEARWQYRFVSFVKGSPGQSSCACFFDVDVNWGANDPAPTAHLNGPLAGSINCTLN